MRHSAESSSSGAAEAEAIASLYGSILHGIAHHELCALEQLPNSAIQQVAALFSQSLCFTLQHMQYLGCSAPICTLAFGRSSFRCIGAVSPQQQKAAKRRRVLEGPSLNFMFAALSKALPLLG